MAQEDCQPNFHVWIEDHNLRDPKLLFTQVQIFCLHTIDDIAVGSIYSTAILITGPTLGIIFSTS